MMQLPAGRIGLKKWTGLLTAALLLAAADRFCSVPVLDSLKCLLFLLTLWAPGAAVMKRLRISVTPLESLLVSFAIGCFFLLALYLILAALSLQSLFCLIPAFLGIAGAAGLFLWRKRGLAPEKDGGELYLAGMLSAAALGLVLLSLTASNLDPLLNGPRGYHVDLLNSVGLVDSAYRGFPLEDVKAAGIPYAYHLLASAFLAVMKSAAGFSNFDLITRFSLTVFTPFAAASLFALTKRLTGRNAAAVLAFAGLFLLRPFENSFLYYLYQDTLGFSLSVAFLSLALLFFLMASEDDRIFSARFLLSAAMLVLAAAAKGPVAAVCLVGFGFSLLMQLLRRRRPAAALLRGAALLAAFLLSYLLFYGGGGAGLVTFYPGRFVYDTRLYTLIGGLVGGNAVLPAAAAMLVTTFSLLTLGFLLLLIRLPRAEKTERVFAEFTVGASAAGLLLFFLTHQYGGSEIYFALAPYPFAVIGVPTALFEAVRKQRRKQAAIIAVLASLSALGAVVPAGQFFSERVFEAGYYRQNSPYRIVDEYQYMALEAWRDDSVTDSEYEALVWLREETARDAVIATDRVLLNSKYMYGTAFSERRFFLEGYIYITSYDETSKYYGAVMERVAWLERVYAGQSAADEIRRQGIDYLLVSRWMHPDLTPPLPVVFENRDVRIYAAAP